MIFVFDITFLGSDQFLTRDITKRLGTKESGGMAKLQEHPFFKGIDWEKASRKELDPIFVPDVKILFIFMHTSITDYC